MNSDAPSVIYLKDYQSPNYWIKSTALKFELFDDYTLVTAELAIVRNGDHAEPLILHGEELELIELLIDGEKCSDKNYVESDDTLTVLNVKRQFSLNVITRIYPQSNSSLEGLYRSRTMYCTQCEAEGFRKITYYLDRPDVLSVFTVTIEADKKEFPVLLSNGNCIAAGDLDSGRHFTRWQDPFPKPSYLFALVAGSLSCVKDSFTTASGNDVKIEIYVEPKDLDKCDHAILALKNAMAWDEKVYGREYDLDVYMIVAVDDFNMGAMENKGLNIFNTSCVLASEETTTDQGFQRVEGVIAHEYFHNWSGNRVTCRDWFQLSLKEGFTVFRDEEFSADMGSRTVKRVEDVQLLRSLQFAEDAGPMAHPVRPASYIEISNFYTLTVYEKGAEVVRMIRTLIGESAFRKGSDLYFERHDGSAATIEDFIAAMTDASGQDFTQFMNWYSQAGTPKLKVDGTYNPDNQSFSLTIAQTCPSTPEANTAAKKPYLIPIALGLIGASGPLAFVDASAEQADATATTHLVLKLTESVQTFTFNNVRERPVPALLRDFSAPVNLEYLYSSSDLLTLMKFELDGFCRWDATQKLAVNTIKGIMSGATLSTCAPLIDGLKFVLEDETLDPAMVALMLALPGENFLGLQFDVIDVDLIHNSLYKVKCHIVQELESLLWGCYQRCAVSLSKLSGVGADVIALRSLKSTALDYLIELDNPVYQAACMEQFKRGAVMSDVYSALRAIVHSKLPSLNESKSEALSLFYNKWQDEALVVNQWFAVQASSKCEGALATVKSLLEHRAFDYNNPNKIRSVIGVFCNQNHLHFHLADGSGYEFLADQIIRLNGSNPQVAARLVAPLSKWQRYDESRQTLMKEQLSRIANHNDLSKDVFEIVSKSLKG